MSKIAWIGLGHMGVPMSANMVGAGHEVVGVDISAAGRDKAREVGVVIVDKVSEAVRSADVVFTMLQNGNIVSDVLTGPEGAFAHMKPGSIAVDCSTTSIDTAKTLHTEAKKNGVSFVDAPVSGGVEGAVDGTLALMLGGDVAPVEKVLPLLDALGSYVVHVGPSGDGQKMKIVNNAMLGVAMAASCEASVLAETLGLDPTVFYNVVLHSSGDSWAFRKWFPLPGVVPTSRSSHGYEPGFMADLLLKDLRLATQTGADSGVRMEIAAAAERMYAEVSLAGAGQKDCTVLAPHLLAESAQISSADSTLLQGDEVTSA